MKCKNCGHPLVVDGLDGLTVDHRTLGMGIATKCPYCDCIKPERMKPPILCVNCGCEIKFRKGRWFHIHLNETSAGGQPRYVGSAIRELIETCYTHNCGEAKPI